MNNRRHLFISVGLLLLTVSADAHFKNLKAAMELNFQANDFDRVKVVLQSVARDADYSYSDFSSSKENSVTVNIQLKNIDGVVVAIFGIIDEGDLREPLAIAIDCQGECSSWKKVASSLRERLSMYWDVNNVETDR